MNLKPTTLVLATLLSTLAIGGLATASHGPHWPCNTSTFSVGNSVRVDVWADNQCAGATVYSPWVFCLIGQHLDFTFGLHVLILYANGCETGAIQELP